MSKLCGYRSGLLNDFKFVHSAAIFIPKRFGKIWMYSDHKTHSYIRPFLVHNAGVRISKMGGCPSRVTFTVKDFRYKGVTKEGY